MSQSKSTIALKEEPWPCLHQRTPTGYAICISADHQWTKFREIKSIHIIWEEINCFHAAASETHYDTPKPIVLRSCSELIKRDFQSSGSRVL